MRDCDNSDVLVILCLCSHRGKGGLASLHRCKVFLTCMASTSGLVTGGGQCSSPGVMKIDNGEVRCTVALSFASAVMLPLQETFALLRLSPVQSLHTEINVRDAAASIRGMTASTDQYVGHDVSMLRPSQWIFMFLAWRRHGLKIEITATSQDTHVEHYNSFSGVMTLTSDIYVYKWDFYLTSRNLKHLVRCIVI